MGAITDLLAGRYINVTVEVRAQQVSRKTKFHQENQTKML
jgi:hypothetical protein